MACRIGGVGQLVPGMQSSLEPVTGIENGGALRVKGPNVMKGICCLTNRGHSAAEFDRRRMVCNRNIVEFDADDFIHIRGRVKRFAKIAGEMISLEVVERIAAQAAGFAHAASSRPDASGRSHRGALRPRRICADTLVAAANRRRLRFPAPSAVDVPLLGSETDYVRRRTGGRP